MTEIDFQIAGSLVPRYTRGTEYGAERQLSPTMNLIWQN